MNPAEVLALYDQTMRRDAAAPEAVRVSAEPVVRLLEHAERRGMIVHATLSAGDADEIVAIVEGEPASIGWIDFGPGKPFSGLWGGETRAAFRRRGLYTALVASRVQEARARGVRYLAAAAGEGVYPHRFVLRYAANCG